jgi:hypothetical protein
MATCCRTTREPMTIDTILTWQSHQGSGDRSPKFCGRGKVRLSDRYRITPELRATAEQITIDCCLRIGRVTLPDFDSSAGRI